MTPVQDDELERAADLIANFSNHLQKCLDDIDAKIALLKQVVEKVYVEDDKVVAMTLQSNCHLVLGHNVNEPTDYSVDPFLSGESFALSGDDELRSLTCTQIILFLPRHIARRCRLRLDDINEYQVEKFL